MKRVSTSGAQTLKTQSLKTQTLKTQNPKAQNPRAQNPKDQSPEAQSPKAQALKPPAPAARRAPAAPLLPHRLLEREIGAFLAAVEGDRSSAAPFSIAAGSSAAGSSAAGSGGVPRLEALAGAFGLSEFERGALALGLAAELFPARFAQVAQTEGASETGLTAGLALSLLDSLPGAGPAAFLPGGALRQWGLLESLAVTPGAARSAVRSGGVQVVPAGVLAYLQGHDGPDPALSAAPLPDTEAPLSASQQALVAQLQQFLEAGPGERAGALSGDDRLARAEVARRALQALKADGVVLSVSLAALEGEAALTALARDARLHGHALLLDAGEAAAGETERVLERLSGLAVVLQDEALPLSGRRAVLPLEVRKPDVGEQRALWSAALGLPDALPAEAAGLLSQLTDVFNLDAARVGALSREVRADLAGNASYPARLRRAWSACRVAGRRQLGALAQRIDTGAGWDDVVLPDSDAAVLRQIVAHVRHRAAVSELLGAPSGGRGRAVAALFSGPSGTGKTLSAEVVAGALELDLYRIDLSGMVSKYIGETEKNLKQVFDAADAGGAVLLFDEADALFGKRSEVKDAHDRYANIQVNYLLQRLEAFSGVAILTTNLESSMDPAFMRRLQFVLNFRAPQAAERERLWRRVFPAAVDVSGLDFARLAQEALPGGSIRNVAVSALYLSVSRGEALSMAALEEALTSERRKSGRLNLSPLGDHPGGWRA